MEVRAAGKPKGKPRAQVKGKPRASKQSASAGGSARQRR
jgi:hypothetical protein